MLNKRAIRAFSLILLFLCSLGGFLVYREVRTIQTVTRLDQVKTIYANIHGPLRGYYIDFDELKYTGTKYTFDDKGIPLFATGDGSYYHSVLISQFALGAYEHYLKTKDATGKEKFLVCADWLKENLKQHGNFYYWESAFKHPKVAEVPWVSAMDQGEGASVLVRAFSITGDTTYLETAKKAILPIFYDLSVGGISIVKGENYIFPQEFPTDLLLNVLNGGIFAYLGVHDYYRVTNDQGIKTIDDKILKTFLDTLDLYDTGYWSLYCQCPNHLLASPYYQILHMQLLRVLYSISNEKKFLKFAEKFEYNFQSPMNQVEYVLANHLRQIRNFTPHDGKKILNRLGMILRREVD